LQQRVGREQISLEFAKGEAQLLCEARQLGARAEQLKLVAMPRQQGAQNHHAAFLIEHRKSRLA
jgi:hypothetical protein